MTIINERLEASVSRGRPSIQGHQEEFATAQQQRQTHSALVRPPFRFQVAVFFFFFFFFFFFPLGVSDATRLESIKIYRCRLFFFCLSTILNRFNYY